MIMRGKREGEEEGKEKEMKHERDWWHRTWHHSSVVVVLTVPSHDERNMMTSLIIAVQSP